jgi:hypothetical protein
MNELDLTLPENLDTITEEEMQALATQLNAIEPGGTHIAHGAEDFFLHLSMLDVAYVLVALTAFALTATALLLLFPAIRYRLGLYTHTIYRFKFHKSFGDFYNHYFS